MFRLAANPLVISALLLALLIGLTWRGGASKDIEVGAHRTQAGHAFHYMQMPKAKEVTIILAWPHDWLDRGGAVAVPHVGTDLLLNDGAGERDAATMAADFQDLNAIGNLYATPDHVVGRLRVVPANLVKAAEIARDVLASPHLDDRWRKRLQRNLKADLLQNQQRLQTETWDTINRFVLGDAPLNGFHSMQPASLYDDVTTEDIKAWHAETFVTDSIKIAAAGPLKPAVVADAIDRLLDGVPAKAADDGNQGDATRPSARFVGKTILLEKPDAEKSLITVVGQIPSTREPGHLLDRFPRHILGSGLNSRLSDAVRNQLRATYAIGAGIDKYDRNTRLIYLSGEVDTDRLEDAYAAFRETYETLRTGAITEEEFERVKEVLIANVTEARKKPRQMARTLMNFLLDDDPLTDRAGELPEVIDAITLDEVNASLSERLPAFDDMISIVATSKGDAIDADCVISSFAEADRCHE